MKKQLDMWRKLIIVSFGVNILSIPFFLYLQWCWTMRPIPKGSILPQYAHYSILIVIWVFVIPLAYSMIFGIWHWHTRFKGKHPLFWPVFTILAYPMSIPGAFIIYLTYFFMHVLPDIRERGAYSPAASILKVNPSAPLPVNHNFAKSVWLSLGWSLIVLGFVAATSAMIGDFVMWNLAGKAIVSFAGKSFTQKIANSFVGLIELNKMCVTIIFLCATTSIIGAIFLQIGYKLKPAKMDETKKDMERIEECGNKDG